MEVASRPHPVTPAGYVPPAAAQASTPLMFSQSDPLANTAKLPTRPERQSCCRVFLTWFITCLFGCVCFQVQPNEEVLVLFWGRLNRVYRPALAFEVAKTVVVDLNGNPVVVSGVVTYRIVDAVRAGLDVGDVPSFLASQALATLKRVCSKYPFEARDGPSLQHEPEHVMREMVVALQAKADLCGARILSFELSDLQYDASVAAAMLVRQQAQALLDARRVIVDGGVEITMSAMARLGERGVALDERDRVRLASNLLCIITGESKVQPALSV